MNKVELLSPAGDLEKAIIALEYGADAIYLGAKAYSLRARASNFDFEEIKNIANKAHSLNKKIYVVVNILCHNAMINGFSEFIKKLLKCNPDGLIVADPYIIKKTREFDKNIEIHTSTQQSVTNSKAALFFKRNGATRVVLAREISYEEIVSLIKNLNSQIEVEYFIHGAVCIAYSGRCMMSNNYSLRDANVGGCAQSCRWVCELSDDQKIYTDKFTMSAKDMAQMINIEKLIDAKINSFKVEGRMKSTHYIATIISAYRQAIDQYTNHYKIDNKSELLKEIENAANRETSIAWFNGLPSVNEMLYHDVVKNVNQLFAFQIEDKNKDGYRITSKNYFNVNQKFEVISGKHPKYVMTIKSLKDENGLPFKIVNHPMKTFYVTFNEEKELCKYDIARIKTN